MATQSGQSAQPHTPYAFKLQGVINSQADDALSDLGNMIQVKGYDWLEDYMANVMRVAERGRGGARSVEFSITPTTNGEPAKLNSSFALPLL